MFIGGYIVVKEYFMFCMLPSDEKLFSPFFIHKKMLDDNVKAKAYYDAIYNTVKKNDIVLEIGTGTGILAFWAIQAGASKVYAIEAQRIIRIAQKLARLNNLSDKIIWFNDLSYNVQLPEKCDVLITETLGNFGIDENILNIIIDAKNRLLVSSPKIVPSMIDLFICPIENMDIYSSITFTQDNICAKDFHYDYFEDLLLNTSYVEYLSENAFLSIPKKICSIDLMAIKKTHFKCKKKFNVHKDGILHGFGGWFTSLLSEKIVLGNEVNNEQTHWRQAFFPVKKPVIVKKNDSIEFGFNTFVENKTIVFEWNCAIKNNDNDIHYCHSTYASQKDLYA